MVTAEMLARQLTQLTRSKKMQESVDDRISMPTVIEKLYVVKILLMNYALPPVPVLI